MRACIATAIFAANSLLGMALAVADDNPWPERAAMDLQAIHDLIAADHPGPALDPGFADQLEAGFTSAMVNAADVDNVAGYIYLLMGFTNGLPDNHLAVWGARGNPEWNRVPRDPTMYPGFVTAYRDGRFVVRDAHDVRPLRDGLQLLACDGASIEQLAASNIFAALGKADQPADWARFGALLLVDQGIIGFQRPHICTFWDGEQTFDVVLRWREVTMSSLGPALQDATFGSAPELGARRLANNALWVSLPSFLSDAIPTEAGDIIRDALSAAADAPYVVFDLRGNSGGNSLLADSFAAAAFSADWVNAQRSANAASRPADLVRASTGNRAYFAAARDASNGATRAYFDALVTAVDAAIEAGEPLAQLSCGRSDIVEARIPEPAYSGPVFILTDGNAFSSTLLFTELLLHHPNARHVGWPTRAHGLYGELRQEALPSGWAWFGFSTKAFMANAGEDHGLIPSVIWSGEIGDTVALKAWIAELAAEE